MPTSVLEASQMQLKRECPENEYHTSHPIPWARVWHVPAYSFLTLARWETRLHQWASVPAVSNRLTKLWGNSSFFLFIFPLPCFVFSVYIKKGSLYKSWREEDKICPPFSEEKWEGNRVSLIWRSRACHLKLKYSLEKQKRKQKNWRHLHSLRGRQRWPFQ